MSEEEKKVVEKEEEKKPEAEEAEEEGEEKKEGETDEEAAKRRERNRKKRLAKKKKAKAAAAAASSSSSSSAPRSDVVVETKAGKAAGTLEARPMTSVADLFPDGVYPRGERQEYTQSSNLWRRESAEAKERERMREDQYDNFRKAAEAHRIVRQWARKWIQPGMKMLDIADRIEESLRKTIALDGIVRSIAFPTGLSRNNCAAHYTPNAGDTNVLEADDVLKVDIGLQCNGCIIDSAFTLCWNHVYDPLLETVRAATNAGVAACGVDVRLFEIGDVVQEVMDSGELELKGRTYRVQPVRGLMGHSLGLYTIHAGKSVPICKNCGDQTKMEEGDVFAIETFGTTGTGLVHDDLETSHYMKAPEMPATGIRGGPKARELLTFLDKHYSTMAFARRWLDQAPYPRYQIALKNLVECGAVNPYPPLCDVHNSYVAQFEHTVALKPTGKEVFSRGDDY